MCSQYVKDLVNIFPVMLEVLFLGFMVQAFGMDDSIVHVDGEVSRSYLGSEDSVHHRLEGCR